MPKISAERRDKRVFSSSEWKGSLLYKDSEKGDKNGSSWVMERGVWSGLSRFQVFRELWKSYTRPVYRFKGGREALLAGREGSVEERRRKAVRKENIARMRAEKFMDYARNRAEERLIRWGFTPRGVLFWSKQHKLILRNSIRQLGFERFSASSAASTNAFTFLLNLSAPWGWGVSREVASK